MPYCSSCGNKLDPDALFCGACGASVAADPSGVVDVPITPPTPAPTPAPCPAPTPAPGSAPAPGSMPNPAPAPAPSPKRRLPLGALIAIVLGIAVVLGVGVGVGFTQFVTRSAGQQQTGYDADQLQKAEEAYQVVVDDYYAALNEYAKSGSSYNQSAFSAKHPYLYTDRLCDSEFLDQSKRKISYAFVNLGDNEVPGLIVQAAPVDGGTVTVSDSRAKDLVAAYTLVDGKPTIVGQTYHESGSLSLVDDKYLCMTTVANDESGTPVHSSVYFDFAAQDDSGYKASSEDGVVFVNGAPIRTSAPASVHVFGSIRQPTQGGGEATVVHPDGTTTTVDGDSSDADSSLRDECSALRPGKVDDIEWKEPTASSKDGQEASEQEPITYSIRTETISVQAPNDPLYLEYETKPSEWKYEQLEPSRHSDAVDKINAAIKKSVEDTAAVTRSKKERQASGSSDKDITTQVCISKDIQVTYQSDSVVCFVDNSYITNYGAHGWPERGGIAFSLETGEQVPMCTVAGVEQSALTDLTCAAEEAYLAANPTSAKASVVVEGTRKILTDDQGKLKKTTPGLEGEERFCLGKDGMYYLTEAYEIGAYAEGTRTICIAGFTDQSVVGTANMERGLGQTP